MKNEGTAVASMILGIVGLVLLFIPGINWLSLACAIVGLILGVGANKKIKASNGTLGGNGMALAGIILSIITLGLFLLFLIACGAILGSFGLLF